MNKFDRKIVKTKLIASEISSDETKILFIFSRCFINEAKYGHKIFWKFLANLKEVSTFCRYKNDSFQHQFDFFELFTNYRDFFFIKKL